MNAINDVTALSIVEAETKIFELAQRRAQVYAQSTLVPKEYRGNVGNVLIAMNLANRLKADILLVMQNLYVIHGKPCWSSQFLIASFNGCGRFGAIRYRMVGTPGKPDFGCIAMTTEKDTGDVIEGTKVDLAMARAEGWSTKEGTKWATMPEQMLKYRAAAFLIRTCAPEISLGMLTAEEAVEIPEDGSRVASRPAETAKGSERLRAKLLPAEPVVKPVLESVAQEVDDDAVLIKAELGKAKSKKQLLDIGNRLCQNHPHLVDLVSDLTIIAEANLDV